MTTNIKVVQRELVREQLYKHLQNDLAFKLPTLGQKERDHLLLRFLLNKYIVRSKDDDPVFSVSISSYATSQLDKDLIYFKVVAPGLAENINTSINVLAEYLRKKEPQISEDAKVTLDGNWMVYGNRRLPFIKMVKNLNNTFALQLRYEYMQMNNHGLARRYQDFNFPLDQVTEGFASAFNHYFPKYCSVFPDLEPSLGSFFEQKSWSTPIVVINPPFDESLMDEVFTRILDKPNKFILTLPHWKDWVGLQKLLHHPRVTSSKIYPKGTLPFVTPDGRTIYPVEIIEVIIN